jgi:hypothetical protein
MLEPLSRRERGWGEGRQRANAGASDARLPLCVESRMGSGFRWNDDSGGGRRDSLNPGLRRDDGIKRLDTSARSGLRRADANHITVLAPCEFAVFATGVAAVVRKREAV